MKSEKENPNIRYKIIKILVLSVTIVITALAGCSKQQSPESNDAVRNCIVNTRSGKIHSPECQYVHQMSDKNKLLVSDTLTNLLKDGYTICLKCKAGVKKSRVTEIKERIAYPNLFVDDVEITANRDSYLNAIDDISKWYVNHIPTYRKTLQQEVYGKYTGPLNNYEEYILRHGLSKDTYRVMTSNVTAKSVELLSDEDLVLCGNENAAKFYRDNYDRIKFKRYLAYYPCDILESNSDYSAIGDDCVRFLFAVFSRMDSGFVSKYKMLTTETYNSTDSRIITGNKSDVAYGFINLGFKIFDINENFVKVDKDDCPEGYIFKMDKDFKLEKGDILATNGHVHIYLGDGKAISSENIGWGKVNRNYPQVYEICMEEYADDAYRVKIINKNGEESYYTRVYRYLGNPGGE